MPKLSSGRAGGVNVSRGYRQQLQFSPDRPLELVEQRLGGLLIGHVGRDPN